jgi:general secretion pathway protein D
VTTRMLRCVALGLALTLFAGCATGRAYSRGQQAAKRGDWDSAVAFYREALGRDPGRIDVKIGLQRAMGEASAAHIRRARDLEGQDQLAGAIAEYKLASDLDPTNTLAAVKANELERRQRERIEAARPPSNLDRLRQQVRQSSTIPTLDPRVRVPQLKFPSASIRDILSTISAITNINITFAQGLDTQLSRPYPIDVQDASLEDVLNQVLSNNGLAFKVINSKTILVFLDDAQNHGRYDDLYTQVFYLSSIDPQDMVTILNQMIAQPGPLVRPQISQSKSTAAITVRATAPVLAVIEKIIKANDKPKAEVMVEVEILEVDRIRVKQLGLDLSTYGLGFTFSPEVAPPNTAGTFPPAVPPPFNTNTVSQGVSAADFYATVPTAVVKLLESDQKTRTLAKPQIRGAEGGTAITMNLGDRIPTANSFTTAQVTQVGLTTPTTNVTYNPIGVNMTITPRVTYDDEIILDLTVDNEALGGSIDVAGQAMPTFTSRSVHTVLRLRDGESNLLAGLIKERTDATQKGLPGLMRLPFFRNLFGNVNSTAETSDIVIVVTPHIVRSHELTAEDLKPIYIGTGQNFGQTGTPPLIAPETPLPSGVTPASGQAANAAAPAAAPAAPPRAPGVVPIVPVTPADTPPVATPTTMSVVASPSQFQAGAAAPYTVPIMVAGAPDIGTLTLRVTYNPAVLRAQAVAQGTFMAQGGTATTFVPKIDANTGQVDIVISRPSTSGGASGSGLIGSIQFLAMSPGSSQITIAGVAVSPGGQPVSVQFNPATVVVR